MERSVADILLEARDRIGLGHTKGHWAVDRFDRDVSPTDPNAVAWCTEGAIIAAEGLQVCSETFRTVAQETFRKALGVEIDGDTLNWNDEDERTPAQVIDAFDQAVRLAKDGSSFHSSEPEA